LPGELRQRPASVTAIQRQRKIEVVVDDPGVEIHSQHLPLDLPPHHLLPRRHGRREHVGEIAEHGTLAPVVFAATAVEQAVKVDRDGVGLPLELLSVHARSRGECVDHQHHVLNDGRTRA